MNDEMSQVGEMHYDPASMPTSSLSASRAVWYKRPWFLITVVVVVVVAVSVITDLPKPVTVAEDTASQNSVVHQINVDIRPCTFGLEEAVSFHRRETIGHPTTGQMKVINTYLVSDQTVCSFAAPSMSELTNNLQIVDTPAGKYLEKMRAATVTWMDSDANGVIHDIWLLSTHQGNSSTLNDLKKREFFLAQDRQVALDDLARADNVLGTTLATLDLPSIPPLLGN